MPLVDTNTGKEFQPYSVTPPEEVGPSTIKDAVKRAGADALRILPRAGLMTGGAEAGAAVGALGGPAAPVTVPVGAAIGAGLSNVAGKYLPRSLGGDPSESTLHAFGWGVAPEGVARGVAGAVETHVLKRAAGSAHDAIVNALDKGPMPAEAAGATASALGRAALARPPVLTGNALTDATNSLRKNILDPITQTRRKLGEPIGKAYDALKGNTEPINEPDAQDLADAARNVRDSLISPAPQSANIFAKIKRFVGKSGEVEEGHQDTQQIELPGGDIIQHKSTPVTRDNLKLQGMSEEQIDKILGTKAQPPTLDQLRELRQTVNERLRSASGGDVHALAGLQQAIDEKLMDHLPPGISRDRELYRGFIQRFPWRDVNKINQMGTPRELSGYVFGGTPERAAEIVDGAGPQGRIALKDALIDHTLSAINPDSPLDEQVKQAQKVLSPYVADGTASRLFGRQGVDELREVFYAPAHRAQMAKIIAEPAQRDIFVNEATKAMRGTSRTQLDAADRGFQKLVDSLPPPERQRFTQPAVPGAEMPVLPDNQAALKEGLTPGPSKLPQRMANRAQFTGPYAVGRAAMGSPAFAVANLMAMAGIATTSAGYRAIMENGGASALAKLYGSGNGRLAARATLELLTAIGSQAVSQNQAAANR